LTVRLLPRAASRLLAVVLALAGALALSLAAAPPAVAHIVADGLGMQTFVKVTPTSVTLEYNLGYSEFAGFAELLKIESDRDDIVEQEEIEAFLDSLEKVIASDVSVSLDGTRLSFVRRERKIMALFAGTNVKEISGAAFDTWWNFRCDVEVGPGEHRIEIRDNAFPREKRTTILWFEKRNQDPTIMTYAFEPVPAQARTLDVGTDWQVLSSAATLYVEFQPSWYRRAAEALAASVTAAASPPASSAVASTPSALITYAEEQARLLGVKIDYRGGEESKEGQEFTAKIKDATWYWALVIALLWGAAHALAPGHGKSMVAAYLVGTRGRVVDAIKLGWLVTFAHAGSIFVVAIIATFAAERVFGVNPATAAGVMTIGLEVGAGLVIFLVGTALLFRRLSRLDPRNPRSAEEHDHGIFGHAHDHSHGAGHAHEHAVTGEEKRSLLALGLSAGLQPCTAGLMLVFISIQQQWMWWGLVVLLAFSLGLGLVIVAIAVSMVAAKSFVSAKAAKESIAIRLLPSLSAAALTGVGAYMVVDCFMRNKIGPFAHT